MNEISVRQDLSLGQLSKALVNSSYFNDVRQAEQAVVKVMAGMELGFGPIASMTGINIIKGKVSLSANFMAAKVKSHPKYDYRIEYWEDDGCTIAFYQYEPDGTKDLLGNSSFNDSDRKKAKLSGDNWNKFPKAMYFARAISQGVRAHTPDIFHGAPVYVPEEMGTQDVVVQMEEAQAVEVVETATEIAEEEPEKVEEVEETENPKKGAEAEAKAPIDLDKAYYNWLKVTSKEKERVSERRFYGVLRRHGLRKRNEIPSNQRKTAEGLTMMQTILNELRALPSVFENEGFDEELEHYRILLAESGYRRVFWEVVKGFSEGMEPDELLDLQGDVEAPDEGLGLWHKVVLQETTRAECMNALDAALKDYDVIAA
tara:strand:+ start:1888 stop:3003 length:1116 start_codon:yes stop_codon:yes gene_type:complete